jgi:endoglycosylceramidase
MRLDSLLAGAALVATLLLATTGPARCEQRPGAGFVRTDGRWLVDAQGRVLILHGVNLAASAKTPPFLPWQTREQVLALRPLGFNSVRYLIVWEGVEPQPGRYDDAYLDRVAERLQWCREAGLKVVLDMHQDLYARKYGGDGAPEWACLDDGLTHNPGSGGWFMGYLSPAVMRCFDNFYANKPAADGVGILDRFVAMWQHVAARFRDDTNVVGYNLLNEPAYGSDFNAVMGAIAVAATKELGPEAAPLFSQADIGAAVGQIVQALIKKDALFKVLDAASAPAQQADRAKIQPFYDRLATAIRATDPHHVILFDAPYGDMSGTRLLTAVEAPQDGQGRALANVVFAPHFYDFSSDFNFTYSGTQEYLSKFLARAKTAGDRMGVPTWFGEWGTWGGQASHPDAPRLVRHHVDAFDEMLCGWAYWEYGADFTRCPFMSLLTRPYAEATAGVPSRMRAADDRFELEFAPAPDGGETIIWVPPTLDAEAKAELKGGGSARVARDAEGVVHVACPAGAQSCAVTIALSAKR